MTRYEDYTDRLAELEVLNNDEVPIDRLLEDEVPFFPPTCEDSPQECHFEVEQEGYEEKAVMVTVCTTHGTERR